MIKCIGLELVPVLPRLEMDLGVVVFGEKNPGGTPSWIVVLESSIEQ